MLYSIGYQRRTVDELDQISDQLDARILDVRGRPISRKPGWGGNQLRERFGSRYEWRGSELGNRGGHTTTATGLRRLGAFSGDHEHAILLCQCDAPGECHRHFMIAVCLDFTTYHLWQNEIIESVDLQAFLDAGGSANPVADYAYRALSPDFVDFAIRPRYSPSENERSTRIAPTRGGRP